jgi:hypothetical protein
MDSLIQDLPPSSFRMRAWCALTAACAFFACEMQTAGTSVGTGNPTEIEVTFKNDSGSVPIHGVMNVYASTQIPVPGIAADPLVSVPVTDADHAVLAADGFDAVADSLWPRTSVDNGECAFNVVVTGEKSGAVLKGFAYRKATHDFVLRAEDANALRHEQTATVVGPMSPLVELACSMDTTRFSPYQNYFLFFYGTGFRSRNESGHFIFPAIPAGAYQGFLIGIPNPEQPTEGTLDSLSVYEVDREIETGESNPLFPGDVQAKIPTPRAFLNK